MVKSTDIPDIFQPVMPEDYEVLYDAAQYVRAESATVEIEDLNIVVCGFCGGQANLNRWKKRREDIEHKPNYLGKMCYAEALAEVASHLASPISR